MSHTCFPPVTVMKNNPVVSTRSLSNHQEVTAHLNQHTLIPRTYSGRVSSHFYLRRPSSKHDVTPSATLLI